jgi:hypothetical protein
MLSDEALDFSETGNAHVVPPVAKMKTPNVKWAPLGGVNDYLD